MAEMAVSSDDLTGNPSRRPDPNRPRRGLPPAADRLVGALLISDTVREAAAASGLSERQAYRLLARGDVRSELTQRRAGLLRAACQRLAAEAVASIERLVKLRDSETSADTIKLKAASELLNYALRSNEVVETAPLMAEFQNRLDDVEQSRGPR
jgi:hypothetical protein